MYPEAKSVGQWLRHGWYVAAAYIIDFFVVLGVVSWHPDTPHKTHAEPEQSAQPAL